uniref:Uncharacterized protein n=1 Tax=Arundo donax TaxID=35708 RepID=A0A0A8Z600_ARUDO
MKEQMLIILNTIASRTYRRDIIDPPVNTLGRGYVFSQKPPNEHLNSREDLFIFPYVVNDSFCFNR